jgi:signal transduction histidine kinase
MLNQLLSGESLQARPLHSKREPFPFEELCALNEELALIAHDLRQPLTAILANAEFLTGPKLHQTQRSDCYEEIRGSVERMNDLISSLLECSRGRNTLRPASRNIVDTVERAIRMATAKPEFRRIRMKHHHDGLAVGWFDSSRLERAIVNLVLNACEAVSPDSGQIIVTTAGSRAGLQISVWDNGPGISSSIRDTVFRPYVTSGKAGGSGLGLAVAKKVAEDHGGEIQLDGTGDSGTLFTISLPFSIPPSSK